MTSDADRYYEANRLSLGKPALLRWSASVEVVVEGRSVKRGRIVEFEGGFKAFHRDVRPELRVPIRGTLSWLLEPNVVARLRDEDVQEIHYHRAMIDGRVSSGETFYVCTLAEMREHGGIDLNGRVQLFRPIAEWRCEIPWYDVPGPEGGGAYQPPKNVDDARANIRASLGIDERRVIAPPGEPYDEPPAEEPDEATTTILDPNDPDIPF